MATAPSANDLTRQQLDELDALLQRMLALPISVPDGAAGPVPPPAATNWRIDPPAVAPAPTPRLLTPPLPPEPPRIIPPPPAVTVALKNSGVVPVAPVDPVPTPANSKVAPVPVSPQTSAAAPAPRTPDPVLPPPEPAVVVPRPSPRSARATPPPPAAVEPAAVEPAAVEPAAVEPASVEPVAVPVPARPPAVAPPVPIVLQPLVAFNRGVDAVLGLLGPPGWLLRSGFGKNLLGSAGVGLLAYTAALFGQQQGWLSLPFPLPWPR